MQTQRLYGPVKIFSYLILLLMGSAIAYAFIMGVIYWSDIAV